MTADRIPKYSDPNNCLKSATLYLVAREPTWLAKMRRTYSLYLQRRHED